jgi:hypothetical protein
MKKPLLVDLSSEVFIFKDFLKTPRAESHRPPMAPRSRRAHSLIIYKALRVLILN